MFPMGKHAGRVTENGSDPLGRHSCLSPQGEHHRKVSTLSVCQSCINHSSGPTTFHTQQEIMLADREDTNPRRNFLKDIKEFLHQKLTADTIPIILGDFNEEYSNGSSSMTLSEEFNLVDIWSHNHPDAPTFTAYQRGHRRLDMALTSLSPSAFCLAIFVVGSN